MRVVPLELGAIEDGVGAADAGERKALDEFARAQEFGIVAGGPAEQREKIAESFGEKTFVGVGADAGGAVAFRKARAIGAENQRHVRENRRLRALSAR